MIYKLSVYYEYRQSILRWEIVNITSNHLASMKMQNIWPKNPYNRPCVSNINTIIIGSR